MKFEPGGTANVIVNMESIKNQGYRSRLPANCANVLEDATFKGGIGGMECDVKSLDVHVEADVVLEG